MSTTLREAITAFKGDMRRRMLSDNAQDRYGRELDRFAAHAGERTPVVEIGPGVCRSWLDTFDNHEPSTVALEATIMSSFFRHLVLDEVIDANPMDKVRRPKVPQLRDRKRVRITGEQVATMLEACETWPERMCLYSLAYLGVRRTALANLRWRDVDGKQWTATFREKGAKRIEKPIPHELRKVWTRYAIECGPLHPDDFVVPNRKPLGHRGDRSPRVVYCIVRDVADRCGIKAHVHAFRAAFAVQFLESKPDQLEALRNLMGHASMQTTLGYADGVDTGRLMREVVDLSFGERSSEDDLSRSA